MKRIIFCLALVLSGCTMPDNPVTGTGSVRDVLRTASGYVMEGAKQAAATIELGKMGVKKAASVAGDLQKWAGEFQEGVESVQKGKELIEKAVEK